MHINLHYIKFSTQFYYSLVNIEFCPSITSMRNNWINNITPPCFPIKIFIYMWIKYISFILFPCNTLIFVYVYNFKQIITRDWILIRILIYIWISIIGYNLIMKGDMFPRQYYLIALFLTTLTFKCLGVLTIEKTLIKYCWNENFVKFFLQLNVSRRRVHNDFKVLSVSIFVDNLAISPNSCIYRQLIL